jgi:hypothetical protein
VQVHAKIFQLEISELSVTRIFFLKSQRTFFIRFGFVNLQDVDGFGELPGTPVSGWALADHPIHQTRHRYADYRSAITRCR